MIWANVSLDHINIIIENMEVNTNTVYSLKDSPILCRSCKIDLKELLEFCYCNGLMQYFVRIISHRKIVNSTELLIKMINYCSAFDLFNLIYHNQYAFNRVSKGPIKEYCALLKAVASKNNFSVCNLLKVDRKHLFHLLSDKEFRSYREGVLGFCWNIEYNGIIVHDMITYLSLYNDFDDYIEHIKDMQQGLDALPYSKIISIDKEDDYNYCVSLFNVRLGSFSLIMSKNQLIHSVNINFSFMEIEQEELDIYGEYMQKTLEYSKSYKDEMEILNGNYQILDSIQDIKIEYFFIRGVFKYYLDRCSTDPVFIKFCEDRRIALNFTNIMKMYDKGAKIRSYDELSN